MVSPNKLTSQIVALLVCAVLSFGFIYVVSAQSNTVVNAAASNSQPQVGSTLTVTLTISNVQNLAGIDTTLQWNPSVLTLTNVALNLGDSSTNGVLHGTNLNYDANNLNSGDIFVQENKVSGSYELIAQSIGASNPGFTGNGTITTLTFNVVGAGAANLSLRTDLADHPPVGQTANNIDHQDTVDTVTTVASGTSSTPISSSSPGPSSTIPEFPSNTIITLLIIMATVTVAFSTKLLKKREAGISKLCLVTSTSNLQSFPPHFKFRFKWYNFVQYCNINVTKFITKKTLIDLRRSRSKL